MGRLGLVATAGRGWRPYAAPVAFLLAATLVVAVVRNGMHHHGGAPAGKTPASRQTASPPKTPQHKPAPVYVVRAGDTMTAIAARTGVSVAKLEQLNPRIAPTALFIGEKIQLR
jgi:LysM repeat protein